MKLSNWRTLLLSLLWVPSLALSTPAPDSTPSVGRISTRLPDTVAGKIGAAMIAHINTDSAESIQLWANTILSTSVDASARATLQKELAVATRDSGGVDFVDARTQGPPGMLVVTVKARRTGQRAALVLLPDAAEPGKLAIADMAPIDDPALYADWPKAIASSAEIARLAKAAMDQLDRTTDFSGCLSISDGRRVLFDECRGFADRTFGVKASPQTKFRIGSMNKMFTAVAIAQLVESGKLEWDTPMSKVMPEFPDHAAAAEITVWQLLHHTAGLGDIFVPAFFSVRESFKSPRDYLKLIASQPKVSAPGAGWNYSNAGYVLLGRIVENVSGEPYFDYIDRHVFAPAGMKDSGFDSQDDVTAHLATGYLKEGVFARSWKTNWMTLPFKGSPAGGGYSTNGDLLRFAAALRAEELVGAATLKKMFSAGVPVGPGTYAAGFGERVSNGRHIRGHAGGAPGMSANLAMVWETGAAVSVTSNQGDTPTAMLLSERIADLLAANGRTP